MTKKFSIIIPAYKVDNCIEKCIRSLENQDLSKDDYEIIVTNDGSPDRCREIVESLQQEFSNIILINQENQGVSMARNNAIAKAQGEYILPIDPDDYVIPNVLKIAYQNAVSRNLDILYLAFQIFDKEEKSVWETDYTTKSDTVFNGVEGYFASRGFEMRDPDRSWAILYRLDMLRQYEITYPKNVPFLEDGLFLGKVFSVAKRVGFSSAKFYQRTTRIGSATNSKLFFSEKSKQGFINALKDVKVFGQQNQLSQEQQYLINHIIAKFVILSLSPSMAKFDFGAYFKIIRILKKDNLSRLNTDGLRFLYKKQIRVYNFSKLLFPFYFRFFNK
jgi:glycosyltransferase involved in cell wall biosynthesis